MPSRPYMPVYVSDRRGDVALQSCSLAARGLWFELQCIMHQSTPYGHLRKRSGEPLGLEEIAMQVHARPLEVKRLLDELEGQMIFARSVDGAIYSQDMIDVERRLSKERARKSGGNSGGSPGGIPEEIPMEFQGKSGWNSSGMLTRDRDQAIPSQAISNQLAPLANGASTETKTPPQEFAVWFMAEARDRGVIAPHVLGDEAAWLDREMPFACKLLEHYSREECERRSLLLMTAIRTRKIRRSCTIETLAMVWDWSMINTSSLIQHEQSSQITGAVDNANRVQDLTRRLSGGVA